MTYMNEKEITDYVFIEAQPKKADLIFIFGAVSSGAEEKSAKKAFELYKNNFASKILISGGVNEITKQSESKEICDNLIKLGVKKEDIILENESTNTLENVLFSKKIIEEKIGFENIKTILAVMKSYHARRAIMTLKKHFPKNIEFLPIPYDMFDFTRDNWQDSEMGKKKAIGEFDKIKQYLKEGDIEEL